MEVQAQYPSKAFAADFRTRVRNNLYDEFQIQNHHNAFANLGQPQILNGTVFSDPESELTCIASGTRKRKSDGQMAIPTPQISQQQCFRYSNLPPQPASYDQSRLSESGTTSTSGRTPAYAPPPVIAQDLVSHLYHQSLEVDALIRLQCISIIVA
ncbi:hypothetical protein QJS10_CPA16g00749 [Acorus calamus]|uniref:Uncharacterized protein n=1 Tax=Acorus calamus TaxID=4465 RepID=A0AAV9D1N4_ACOCL|nr:hypothetical protein QJS10_CPA16g00749 [Acorus calamus]